MKRTTFENESRLVGEDFGALIEREGGKSAGLHLLRRGIEQFKKQGKLDVPSSIGTADWYSSGTHVYTQLEQIWDDLFKGKHKEWEDMRYEAQTHEVLNVVSEEITQVGELFPGAFSRSQHIAEAYAPKFHLRSSTTLEDFQDDRYFATFTTLPGEAFFCHGQTKSLVDILFDFYCKKRLLPQFEIGSDATAGFVVMPTVGTVYDRDVIVYSGYPEVHDSPALMETWIRQPMEGKRPLEFVRARSTHEYERIPMNMGRYGREGEPLSNEDVQTIYMLSHAFQSALGYRVNLELTALQEGIVPYQLRPVPVLSEHRVIKELSPVPTGMEVVAQTPFVMGSFRKTARLVRAHYKNDYTCHQFTEDVIMWHTNDLKGHRFYDSDARCIAMLNPEEGAALTHDSHLLPGFGPARDRYAFMGVPLPGFRASLERCMHDVSAEGKDGKAVEFSYTPFPLTLESDGRSGRVLVERKHASHFSDNGGTHGFA